MIMWAGWRLRADRHGARWWVRRPAGVPLRPNLYKVLPPLLFPPPRPLHHQSSATLPPTQPLFQRHISIPHALHSRLRNASLAKAPCPRRPIYYGWWKTQWPQVTEENRRSWMLPPPTPPPWFISSVQLFQCLNTQLWNNLHPFNVA